MVNGMKNGPPQCPRFAVGVSGQDGRFDSPGKADVAERMLHFAVKKVGFDSKYELKKQKSRFF